MLIFNLHHVEQTIRQSSRKHLTITPGGLRTFIRTLRLVGMEIVSMRDVLAMADPTADSSRKVLLTFDDGYENNYLEAASVLEEEQCPAIIFVLPGRFSGTNEWDQSDLPLEEQDRLMSLAQMKALATSEYITFGSHGMFHRRLPTLTVEELDFEIHESYNILARELGPVFLPVMAYPWGAYSPQVIRRMAQSPYQYGFTVQTGQWQADAPRFEVPRYSVYYRDGNPMICLAKLCRHGLMFA
jgi:peptidoglycan/xylan/chitin deacetylase (PgdA/CDA1 family)